MPVQPTLKDASGIHIHPRLKARSKQLLFQGTVKDPKPVNPALRSWLSQRAGGGLDFAHAIGKKLHQRCNKLVAYWRGQQVIIASHAIYSVLGIAREESVAALAG